MSEQGNGNGGMDMAWSDDVVTYRRALHRIPELAFQEEATRDYLEEHLTGLGLAPRRAGGTGLVVDIAGQRPGPCLAIRDRKSVV